MTMIWCYQTFDMWSPDMSPVREPVTWCGDTRHMICHQTCHLTVYLSHDVVPPDIWYANRHVTRQLHWWVTCLVTVYNRWHVWWQHIMWQLHWKVKCPVATYVTVTLTGDVVVGNISYGCIKMVATYHLTVTLAAFHEKVTLMGVLSGGSMSLDSYTTKRHVWRQHIMWQVHWWMTCLVTTYHVMGKLICDVSDSNIMWQLL